MILVKSIDGDETVSEKAKTICELLRSRIKPSRTGGTPSWISKSAMRAEVSSMGITGLPFMSAMAKLVNDMNVSDSLVARSRSCLILLRFVLFSMIWITGPLGPGVPAVRVTLSVSLVRRDSPCNVICVGSKDEALTLSEKVRIRVSLFKSRVNPVSSGETRSCV